MSLPKVLVVGSGGVGSIAALSLTLNEKCTVTLVVRSSYQKAVDQGFQISSTTYGKLSNWRPHHLSPSVESAVKEHGPFDFVVLTTKNIPDGPMTCEDIVRPAIVPGKTTIVMMQNGVEIDKPMIKEFPTNPVLSVVTLVGSTNIDCNVVNSHKDTLKLAPFHNPNIDDAITVSKVKEFANLYQNKDAAINFVEIEDSALQSRWEKLIYNSVLNTTCTIAGMDVNRCQINGANHDIFGPAMDEVIAIAATQGIHIDSSTKDFFQNIGNGLFYSPSMLVDSRKKQLFELEVILGNPLRVAKAHGVQTPVLSTMYLLLKMIQFKIKEEIGMVKINEADFKGIPSDDYPEHLAKLQH